MTFGITSFAASEILKVMLKEISDAREPGLYSLSEKGCLVRYSRLTRPFTDYEGNLIRLVHVRIPLEK